MMRLSTGTSVVLLFVAIIAFASGWFIGDKKQISTVSEKADAVSTAQYSSGNDPNPSFQNHVDIKPLEMQQISLEGDLPISQHFSIDRGDTQTLTRTDKDMIIGLVEVESEYIKLNVNNMEYTLQSGNYVDVKVDDLFCRLVLLKYDWSSSSRNAEFSCECQASQPAK